jgi:hypothetical protein
MSDGRRLIADYLLEQARWRGEKAEEYPEDGRNLRCAEGLKALAEYVLSLPATDERILDLTSMGVRAEMFSPPPVLGPPGAAQAQYAISQFRFHDPGEDCDRFLTELVRLMRDDALRFARESGPDLRVVE